MRIIGEIPHPIMKITVFKLENRFNVAFETPECIQTFKIRQVEGIDNFEDIKALIDENFIEIVAQRFSPMTGQISSALAGFLSPDQDDEFDHII